MNNERFAVPELLFRPSDVGIHEMGITEAVVHAINTTPKGQTSFSPVYHTLTIKTFKYQVMIFFLNRDTLYQRTKI